MYTYDRNQHNFVKHKNKYIKYSNGKKGYNMSTGKCKALLREWKQSQSEKTTISIFQLYDT